MMTLTPRDFGILLVVGLCTVILLTLIGQHHLVDKQLDNGMAYINNLIPRVRYFGTTSCGRSESSTSPAVQVSMLNREAWNAWLRTYCENPKPLLAERGYGTHGFVLLAALYLTTGPVLELGTGDFSTSLADKLSVLSNRYILSADNDKQWLTKLQAGSRAKCHDFHHVVMNDRQGVEWGRVGNDTHWSVAFVDQKPAERRHKDVERLLNHSELVIAHDTEDSSNSMYFFRDVTKNTKYHYRWEYSHTQTTVFSMQRYDLVAGVEKLLGWIEKDYG